MTHIEENLKLQFQETVGIQSVPKRLAMNKGVVIERNNLEPFCFPTKALAATNSEESKHDKLAVESVQ
jgi:hypothetical protein